VPARPNGVLSQVPFYWANRVSGSSRAKTSGRAGHTLFTYSQITKFAKGCGPLGESSRHDGIVVCSDFPDKGSSMRTSNVRKALPRQHRSSVMTAREACSSPRREGRDFHRLASLRYGRPDVRSMARFVHPRLATLRKRPLAGEAPTHDRRRTGQPRWPRPQLPRGAAAPRGSVAARRRQRKTRNTRPAPAPASQAAQRFARATG
jgi:hypothetical protein